jgi:ABC-type transporter Mla MlaB component
MSDTLALSGDINLATVNALQSNKLQGVGQIDWAGVTNCDSAALALRLAWQAEHPEVKQINLPTQLATLAGVYGVDF